MKKLIVIPVLILLMLCSAVSVSAEEVTYDMSGVYNSLSEEAKERLLALGADSADVSTLSGLTFEKLLSQIADVTAQQAAAPLKGLISATAMLLICSMLTAYKSAFGSDMNTALDLTLSLCLCAAVAIPAAGMIQTAGEVLQNASQLMLAFIPVTALLMTASGSIAGSAAHYAAVLGLGEGVMQLSAHVIRPLMNMLLGLGIAGGVSPEVSLGGFTKTLSKVAKWLLAFLMSLFSAVLGLRQVLAHSIDSVSGRAAKFALSSFVPVVGSALGEALKTVRGSVSVMKSGVGVFVILALAVTFLPLLTRTLLWSLTLWIARSTAEVLHLPRGAGLLSSLSDVISVLTALLFCVMTVYIISAAMVFAIGGGAS